MTNELNPIKSRWRRVRSLFFAFAIIPCSSIACCHCWVRYGSPPWDVASATDDPLNVAAFFIGTHHDWQVPQSGGIFRNSGLDTLWGFSGLAGKSVNRLTSFGYCRPERIFAATNVGLFIYESDTTWTQLNSIGFPLQQQIDLAISQFDTTIWAIATWEPLSGGIRLSRSSGQSWSPFYLGPVVGSNLAFRGGVWLYFTEQSAFRRQNLTDSTVATIWHSDELADVAYHPEQACSYVLEFHRVGRYDEATHDTFSVTLPMEIEYASQLTYVPNEGLLIGTSTGAYQVSDDLETWTACHDSVMSTGPVILSASNLRCIATGQNRSVFTCEHETSTAQIGRQEQRYSVQAYPNPATSHLYFNIPPKTRVVVYDLLGRMVSISEWFEEGGSNILNVENYPSGTYFYHISFYASRPGNPIVGSFAISK